MYLKIKGVHWDFVSRQAPFCPAAGSSRANSLKGVPNWQSNGGITGMGSRPRAFDLMVA
jgi:hypothetical protein